MSPFCISLLDAMAKGMSEQDREDDRNKGRKAIFITFFLVLVSALALKVLNEEKVEFIPCQRT